MSRASADRRPDRVASIRGAVWLGGAHLVVDAACVTAVLRAGPPNDGITYSALAFVLGYDLLAFAGQVPCGWLVDRMSLRRGAAMTGIVLTAVALLLGHGGGWAVMAVAGLANALFHVGAGAMTLAGAEERAAPAGVFVAPGALGLGLGIILGRQFPAVAVWPFFIALAVALAAVALVSTPARASVAKAPAPAPTGRIVLLGLLLSLSVAVRSLVGTVGCDECQRGLFLLVAIPVSGFAGKLAGGFLADRFGWIDVCVVALLASAPLLAFSGGDLWLALPGLAVFQMTMPVTLAAMFRLMPGRPGLGFGILCLALVAGTLPAYLPGGFRPKGVTVLLLVLGSAAALFLALRMLLSPSGRHHDVAAVPQRPPSTLCRGNP